MRKRCLVEKHYSVSQDKSFIIKPCEKETN